MFAVRIFRAMLRFTATQSPQTPLLRPPVPSDSRMESILGSLSVQYEPDRVSVLTSVAGISILVECGYKNKTSLVCTLDRLPRLCGRLVWQAVQPVGSQLLSSESSDTATQSRCSSGLVHRQR